MAKSQATRALRVGKSVNQPPAATTEPGDPAAWIQKNRRPLGAAAIIVLAIVGGAWLTMTTQSRKEVAGQDALNVARAAFDAYNLPAAAAAFQEVIQNYSGTRAANEAVLSLNQVRIINGQNELAIVSLREFVGGNPGAVYLVPGSGLLGSALENVNRPSEAADAFLAAASSATVDYLKAEYLLSAAASLRLAGRVEEAEIALRTVVDDLFETPSMTEAKVRLSELTQGGYSDGPDPM